MLNSKQLSLIHVAKSQLGLEHDEYLNVMSAAVGREIKSSKELRTIDELRAVMTAFEKSGFQAKKAINAFAKKHRLIDSTVSKEQISLIESLWQKVTKAPETWRESLNSFLAARFNALNVESLSGMKAINVIEALKDMLLKTALVEVSKTMGACDQVVQNRLLENFKSVKMCFDHEELAAVCAALFYAQPQLFERCKTAAAKFQSKMYHKATGEEIPF